MKVRVKICKLCNRPISWHTLESWAAHKQDAATLRVQRCMRKAGLVK